MLSIGMSWEKNYSPEAAPVTKATPGNAIG